METKCRACIAATYSRLLRVHKMKNALLKNVVLFILFGCFYVTIEVFYRGFSHPLMFFVAGISAVIIDKFMAAVYMGDIDYSYLRTVFWLF